MLSRPLPQEHWIQALADNGAWLPPAEWAQDYGWMEQLPRPLPDSASGKEIEPDLRQPMQMADPHAWQFPPSSWTDIPPWLEALNMDRDYERSRAIESPYGGWGGGAMQARRRGLR